MSSRARELTEDRSTRWQRFWGFVFLAGVVVSLTVAVCLEIDRRVWSCDDESEWFVAYFPSGATLNPEGRIFHADRCVGRARAVFAGVTAVDLTFRPDTSGRTATTFRLPLDLPVASERVPVARAVAGSRAFRVEPSDHPDSIRIVASGAADTAAVVSLGGTLRGDGWELRVGVVERFTVLVGHLDQEEFTASLGSTIAEDSIPRILGPGTRIEAQGLRLSAGDPPPDEYYVTPSFVTPSIRAALAGPDTVSAYELETVGLENLVRGAERAAEFLLSPAARWRGPTSRVEEGVESVTGLVANLDTISAAIGSEVDRPGYLSRAALEDAPRQELEAAIGSLAATLERFEAALEGSPDRPPLATLALTADSEAELQRTLEGLADLATELSNADRTVLARFVGDSIVNRLDEILVEVKELTLRGQETLAVAEDMMRSVRDGLPGIAIGAGIFGGLLSIAALIAAIAG